MVRARTYSEFAGLLGELGFLLFGGGRGLLTLGDVTEPNAWHNPNADDPWEWRKRLCEAHDGVYTRARCGCAFLIANDWYPSFVSAYAPAESYEEKRDAGELGEAEWRLYQLFETRDTWAKHELSREFRDLGRSPLERALSRLQGDMHLVISGETQKLSVDLVPMGWPSMAFTRVDAWLPKETLERAWSLDPAAEARRIRARAEEISPNAPKEVLDAFFGRADHA